MNSILQLSVRVGVSFKHTFSSFFKYKSDQNFLMHEDSSSLHTNLHFYQSYFTRMSSTFWNMNEYYTTNYTKCNSSFTIFATPEFLSISSKIEFSIILPINFLGFYCIIFHSPKYMTTFKWHLFHLQFW